MTDQIKKLFRTISPSEKTNLCTLGNKYLDALYIFQDGAPEKANTHRDYIEYLRELKKKYKILF